MQSNIHCEEIDKQCPVEPGKKADAKYYADHSGERIYFCCEECIDEFKSSPETYLTSIPDHNPIDKVNDDGTRIQDLFDDAWNVAVTTAGLTIVTLLFLALLLLHYAVRTLAPKSRFSRCSGIFISRKAIPAWLALLLGAEALASHLSHHYTREAISDSTLEHAVHYTTFVEYGDPPLPSRPALAPRVRASFYRGNDERSPELYNGGNYRTATFDIDLCTENGNSIAHGDQASFKKLFFRVRFRRAAGTPDYFWKPARMAKIYATRDPGKFHWRDDVPEDLIPVIEVVPLQEWVFKYPIKAFVENEDIQSVSGTFYICEKRYNDSESLIGGRFHCAFSFDLHQSPDGLAKNSDVWMGALYRKRSLRIWEIPEAEWLTTKPIPEIIDGQSSSDPVLLGIHDHENNKN